MHRIVLALLALAAFAVPCLAQVPPLPCSAPGGGLTVRGRIMDPPGLGVDGVACCFISIWGIGPNASERTLADGTFETCFECVSPDAVRVSVTADCCSAFAERVVPQCFDPATGLGVTVDLGDVTCSDAPRTHATVLRGSVLCRSGGLLEPVADCAILVDALVAPDRPGSFVRTDANGDYAACASCSAFNLTVAAQCCGQIHPVDLSACPDVLQIPTMLCEPCPVPPCPLPHDVEVQGRLACGDADGDGVLDPVSGCLVQLNGLGCSWTNVTTTTDANGFYDACVPCSAENDCGEIWALFSQSNCCPDYQRLIVRGCPPVVDLGTRECCPIVPQPCPPGETIVRGRVTCVDPLLPNPIPLANSRVQIAPQSCSPAVYFAMTDANGDYSRCVPCTGCFNLELTSEACWERVLGDFACGVESVVDIACHSCPGLPPCGGQQEVHGNISCGGLLLPEANCPVRITCPNNPGISETVLADVRGDYSACIPCGACDVVRATALCCGVSEEAPTDPGCAPLTIGIACGACRPITAACPMPQFQTVGGRVTCDPDGNGVLDPIPGCTVRIDNCPGRGDSATAVTDANGDYVGCVSICDGCSPVIATALCCGQSVEAPLTPLFCVPARADIFCFDCPPRPCPAPWGTLVSGTLLCAQGNDQAPLAACAILLEALDAGGNVLPGAATTVTDGSGQYSACLPCVNGMASIRATAQCCNVSVVMPVAGCPEMLSLDTMLCADCSPCPAGSTRLQGRIQCRGGGPVANCAIRVVVTTCSDTLVFDAMTDAQGKYRLCIPCPCDDTDVRVTALCCNASRVVHVDRCGPITPLPTIFCPSPCR